MQKSTYHSNSRTDDDADIMNTEVAYAANMNT